VTDPTPLVLVGGLHGVGGVGVPGEVAKHLAAARERGEHADGSGEKIDTLVTVLDVAA
jgi:hypothetical protein